VPDRIASSSEAGPRNSQQTLPPRLIHDRELRTMIGGLSRSTVRRLIAEGRFPRPIVLSRSKKGRPARVAWVSDEVFRWINERIAADRCGLKEGNSPA
jgi:predicted DNA-binding transcriptional regulator AlpA